VELIILLVFIECEIEEDKIENEPEESLESIEI